jgi:hypothetical protein
VPTFSLCYYPGDYFGVVYANVPAGNHTYGIQGYSSSKTQGGGNGIARTQSYHHRQYASDLNMTDYPVYDGVTQPGMRWGDAPPC